MPDHALIEAALGLRELIESEADGIEENCTMSKPVVDAIEKTGLFFLSAPKEIGGIEADIETVASVCEAISFADGSTGWAFTQNTIVGSYLSYIDPEFAKQFTALRAGAGHFAPLGVAHEEEGGYRVSGNWQFATGSGHAEFIGGGAIMMRDGEVASMDDSGKLPLLGFFVPKENAIMKGNWDTMGLRGTGSVDYEIPEQFVETGVTWNINMGYAPHKSGGAAYALGPQAYGCIGSCGWAIGVAARAMHEIAEITKAGRIQLVTIYNRAVDIIENGGSDEECAAAVRQVKAHANYIVKQVAKPAVIFAWESSGSVGMRNPSRLQRCFRDIYIGAGHQVFDDRNYQEFAKHGLGIEPSAF